MSEPVFQQGTVMSRPPTNVQHEFGPHHLTVVNLIRLKTTKIASRSSLRSFRPASIHYFIIVMCFRTHAVTMALCTNIPKARRPIPLEQQVNIVPEQCDTNCAIIPRTVFTCVSTPHHIFTPLTQITHDSYPRLNKQYD